MTWQRYFTDARRQITQNYKSARGFVKNIMSPIINFIIFPCIVTEKNAM